MSYMVEEKQMTKYVFDNNNNICYYKYEIIKLELDV